MDKTEQTLRDYAAGMLGTRQAIDRAGLQDFAELVIRLSQLDLDLPKPPPSAARDLSLSIATAILQARLRHDG